VPGLGTSFGRGGATTAQQDLANADAILIMGSSMAENHPVGFQWVIEARERGATVLHVDPRFTRTSAMADVWVPLRAGTDIAFLGGLIRYVLHEGREFREYLIPYTNAATIIRADFQDTEALEGYFSGWNAETQTYAPLTWLYEGAPERDPAEADTGRLKHGGGHGKDRGGEVAEISHPERDETLQHPHCVYQLLKKHFERYTPEYIERICGVPRDVFLRTADAFCRSGPNRTAAICYAVGWTQHSTGVQIIRAAAILQLLLGNIGRPGGGILALRGHASIQGSTDVPTLYDILPGYLPMPFFEADTRSLQQYVEHHQTKTGWWSNFDKYIVSLLKAYYGDAARKENDWGFNWLPRVTGDHSHFGYWMQMMDGGMDGLFVLGQNPAVGAPNARFQRRALSRLKWLVVRDLVETETASFWYDSPEVARGELRPEEIATEVFLLPGAGHAEKDGCFTNTQRLLQWHEKAVDPPGDCRSETWFIYHLGRRLKARAARDDLPRNAGLRALTWDYSTTGPHHEPVVDEILQEINGWTVSDRKLVSGFKELRNDGSTACGCWIYSGVFPSPGENRARMRASRDFYGHGWGFAWPSDRRILYNRASAAPDGRPWDDAKRLVWWDAGKRMWTGEDVPDFTTSKRPDYRPADDATGDDALRGDQPFIMHPDGVGWIWVVSGLKDGPLPMHYEPLESPVRNELYSRDTNPVVNWFTRAENRFAPPGDPRFPFVLTTYRLTEHHTAGGMSRFLPFLAELQPEMFCEVSPQLAALRGLENGGWVTIATARGVIEARAMVTSRIPPLRANGRVYHQVGLPYHWGPRGVSRGDVVNDLLAISEEPNVRIMESKALVCDVRRGRRPRNGS
jgi:formate dehydrogenase major subunit